ncbi:MAG: LapA family protein [Desulfobacterales bacterium]|jgi:uncharacterized integral membrane protein|nr:LapA family protein [Deltaproteobacteria bacterium]
MGSYVKAILLLIVLVILVTFGINNLEPIRLHYYFGLSSMPLPIYGIVYGALLVGIFVGMLVGINSRFSQRKKIKLLQRENRELKAKVGEESPEEKAIEEPPAPEPTEPTEPEDESEKTEETHRF